MCDNETRADWALQAVETFTDISGNRGAGEDTATMARDLLVNLLHLIRREEPETDIHALLVGTQVCFNEEETEESDDDEDDDGPDEWIFNEPEDDD